MDINTVTKVAAENSPYLSFVFGYLLINVMKRTPKPQNKILAFFWNVVEYLCFLGWTRWGGPLKPLFTVTPVEMPSDEPPAKV
jgi:hypothetical protein